MQLSWGLALGLGSRLLVVVVELVLKILMQLVESTELQQVVVEYLQLELGLQQVLVLKQQLLELELL